MSLLVVVIISAKEVIVVIVIVGKVHDIIVKAVKDGILPLHFLCSDEHKDQHINE